MRRTYSTLVSSQQGYPFNHKHIILPHFQYDVQIKLSISNGTLHQYHKKIKKIIDLQLLCGSLIKLYKITHDCIQNEFILCYQFVPYCLSDIYELKIQINKIQIKMNKICQFLLHKRIRPIYNTKSFGFNQNKELKYFLLPNCDDILNQIQLNQQFDAVENNIKTLINSIKPTSPISPGQTIEDDITSQRISQRDLSAYNKKFEQKISLIQSKLLLSKQSINDISKHHSNNKLSSSQKLKRKKKLSQNFTQQNVSNSSSSSNSLRIHQNKSKGYNNNNNIQQNIFKNQYQQRISHTQKQKFYIKSSAPLRNKSSQQQQQSPQSPHIQKQKSSKLTNSLIIEQQKNQQMQKLKQHKSSFGDYSNYGHQNQKKLKRRISFALEKSQHALKIYQKYQSKRNSNHSSSKRS